MKFHEQEQIVARLASELAKQREGKSDAKLGYGRDNRVMGVSGFKHQIDVSIETPTDLVLYECKHWGRNVGPKAVLVFAARGLDIREAHPGAKVHLNLVVSRALSGGARQLAVYFGVQEQLVKSPSEFSVDYKGDRQIGVVDTAVGSDPVPGTVISIQQPEQTVPPNPSFNPESTASRRSD